MVAPSCGNRPRLCMIAITFGMMLGSLPIGGTLAAFAAITIDADGVVDLAPGQDLQATIDALPGGTAFRLESGLYRLAAPLTPKDGDVFSGDAGAILSGARLLSNFFRAGSYWVVGEQSQQGQVHGSCQPGRARCSYPEELYLDDLLLQHVATFAEVAAGKWYFDYANDRIYLADDPTGRRVETTVTRHAFGGTAAGVTISGLVIEKFANPAQSGAIDAEFARGWTVKDNEIRFNHGIGVRIGEEMQLLRNLVHHNGQLGVAGDGTDVLVQGNEIAYNNSAGFQLSWEGGGTKFVETRNLVVRDNFVHHNDGSGLWTDTDNINTLYEGNRVEDNATGIFHETSYTAVIRRNLVQRNGYELGWLWGAGIIVAASPNVEVYENTVVDNWHGIVALQQARGWGAYGRYEVENLWVHDNTVRMNRGMTGLAQDIGDTAYFTSRNNRFTNNSYWLGANPAPFAWMNQPMTPISWQSYGNDLAGCSTPDSRLLVAIVSDTSCRASLILPAQIGRRHRGPDRSAAGRNGGGRSPSVWIRPSRFRMALTRCSQHVTIDTSAPNARPQAPPAAPATKAPAMPPMTVVIDPTVLICTRRLPSSSTRSAIWGPALSSDSVENKAIGRSTGRTPSQLAPRI